MNASYDALFRIVTGILSLTTKDLVPDELVPPKHINGSFSKEIQFFYRESFDALIG